MVLCLNHVLQHARGGDPNQHRSELATFRRKIDVFGSTVNGFGRAKTAGLPAVFFEGLW